MFYNKNKIELNFYNKIMYIQINILIRVDSGVVKRARLKIWWLSLRGFKSHFTHKPG